MRRIEYIRWSLLSIFFLSFMDSCTQRGGKEKLSENTVRETSVKADLNWYGEWERDEWMSEASLSIKEVEADRINFSLIASSGAHSGDLEGVALASGSTAVYKEGEGGGSLCILEFQLYGDSLVKVLHKEGNCNAGMGVHYSGEYRNTKYTKGKTKELKTLLDLGVFENPKQDSVFIELVGGSYDLFVNSTQFTSRKDDLDSVNANVNASGVRGLSRYMENIIMINPEGHIWAAVIDDDKVLYFTNQKEYAGRLPLTMEAWRFDFQQYPVVYKSMEP